MKKEKSKKYRLFQIGRILSQLSFFSFFLYLLFFTRFTGEDTIGRVEIFFHFDPLLGLTTAIASRAIYTAFWLSLLTIGLTLLLGRVFCGWVCPLGAVHQLFSFLFKKSRLHKPKKLGQSGLNLKYLILLIVLITAFLAIDLVGYLDPFSFLYRSFITAIIPWFAQINHVLLSFVYQIRLFKIGDYWNQFLASLALNPIFQQGFFLGILFLLALSLNLFRERFWCRLLCPLGALLGLVGRRNLLNLKINEDKCIDCHLCTLQCQTQANPYPQKDWDRAECVYCFTCASICPEAAIDFSVRLKPQPAPAINLSRRRLIFTSLLAVISTPFFKITPARKRAAARLIRPPGSLAEPQFLQKCVKCGECLKVCPTNGLQPALGEAGPEGIWTPVFNFKIGYCEYYCSLCSQVCPTGAIKELTIEEKINIRIGTAWVDKSRCIPYVLGSPCIVCEEHCPTSPKAIKLVRTEIKRSDGTVLTPLVPVIDIDQCVGCGICENKCPVVDQPAIFVTSVGESRSPTNRFLLEIIPESPLDQF